MTKFLAVLACAISLCGSTNAAVLKFQYTGTVSSAFTETAEGFADIARIDGFEVQAGNTARGTVTYDTSNPIWFVPQRPLIVYQGHGEITATVLENGFSLATLASEHHQMNVGNDSSLYGGSSDFFSVSGVSTDSSGALVRLVDFFLYDGTGTAFESQELPTKLDLSRFQQADLTVSYVNGDYWTQFTVDIGSLELVTEVPEPASGALLFAGLGLLLGVRRFSSPKIS